MKNSKVVNYPLLKLVLNRIANNFIRLLFLIKYNDITNAFKAYKRELLLNFHPIVSKHFNINAELALKAISRGYKYKVIPISWSNRKKIYLNLILKKCKIDTYLQYFMFG